MKVYLGADHRGFKLKNLIKDWLNKQEYQVIDLGNTELDSSDDYPDFAIKVSESVVADLDSKGIVICGSGVGVTIAGNKVKGARVSTGINIDEVKRGREDDDLNILAISADFVSAESIKDMISVFLTTSFIGDDRHVRRLDKIKSYEQDSN